MPFLQQPFSFASFYRGALVYVPFWGTAVGLFSVTAMVVYQCMRRKLSIRREMLTLSIQGPTPDDSQSGSQEGSQEGTHSSYQRLNSLPTNDETMPLYNDPVIIYMGVALLGDTIQFVVSAGLFLIVGKKLRMVQKLNPRYVPIMCVGPVCMQHWLV